MNSRSPSSHRPPLRLLLLAVAFATLGSLAPDTAATTPLATLRTGSAAFEIDATGHFSAIVPTGADRDYLATNEPAPVLAVRVDGQVHRPAQAAWDSATRRLTLRFPTPGITAVLAARPQPSHLALALAELQPADRVEAILWGPYPTTIAETIGETVGVVRDRTLAIGLLSLNPKTLGGLPSQENDVETGREADDRGAYDDLPEELKKAQSYRGDAARGTPFGSVLQAYCRNRNRDRTLPNWGFDQYVLPAHDDGGVIGSAVALFAGPARDALDTIGRIEVAEGLPHPLIDGVWGKVSPAASASYLIVDFGENTIDRAIDMARRAGLKYVYHSSPFSTWGHFTLKPDAFPRGWDGLKACTDRARQAGIRVGVHTLSNFITPNDPYVTPRPDPRLGRVGASELVENLDATGRAIAVAATNFFGRKTDLNTVRIDEELIRFGGVSSSAPWRLLDCERGAWGTRATTHARGAAVVRLADHGYKVFLTDAALSVEVARTVARLFNHTGLRQLSFDGLEGNWSTGLGQYGSTLFTKAWYDALDPALRGQVINDASNPGHFNWHIYTRMNWGEPWYAGFRESQTLYRFKNQLYFERNLMPRMLGWFALRADTTLEDIEWMLARAAGYHAGFGLATSLASTAQLAADPASADTLRQFGTLPAILDAIRHWETARLARAFPAEIRARLRDNAREFHLAPAGPAAWNLREATTARLLHDTAGSTPTEGRFENPNPGQPLQWTLRCDPPQLLQTVSFALDDHPVLPASPEPFRLPAGATLKYSGGPEAILGDAAGKELGRVPVRADQLTVPSGSRRLQIRCDPVPGAKLKLEVRTLGAPTRITASPSAER